MSEKQIEAKILDWLTRAGYPLEMNVSESFRANGFSVIQSEYYNDPKIGIAREIDVYATLQRSVKGSYIHLSSVIECKADPSKPWIIFSSENVQLAPRARVVQRCSNDLGWKWLHAISHREDIQGLNTFDLGLRPGYGVVSAFGEKDKVDAPYTALMAAAGAATSKAARYNEVGWKEKFFSIHFPVVVTAAPLFQCHLNSSQEMQLEQVNRAVVVWRNPVYQAPHCIIHLVHAKFAGDFASSLMKDFDHLLSTTEKEIATALNAHKTEKVLENTKKALGNLAQKF